MEKFVYTYENHGENVADSCNREVAVFSIDNLLEKFADKESAEICKKSDFDFYASGYQSWGFGGETEKGKHQKKYIPIVPQFKNYFMFPGVPPKKIFAQNGGGENPKNNFLEGFFIIYLRWNLENSGNQSAKNLYLVLASTGNVKNSDSDEKPLPPVKFYVDRKTRRISVTIYSDGKKWAENEKMCEISVFTASDFFNLKDKIKNLYDSDKSDRFSRLSFLNSSENEKILIGGWESWYNHYADINEKIIREDLKNLGKTENLINTHFVQKNKPCVFQVDDGWEQNLGDWEANLSRFPAGMKSLASAISDKNYVPGLWLAPFILDWRSEKAKTHRNWILRDENGKPVSAGFNFLWGAAFGKNQPGFLYSYFCLDLSLDEVQNYLDSLMEKVVNGWGFRYIKLDFLFAGMLRGKFKNGGAAYEWFDKAVKILTKRNINQKGEKVAYLGCGMPFESSFNSFPLSRIGPDTKEAWDDALLRRVNFPARPGAFANLQSTLGHSFWDGGIFVNDPDVVFLRYSNITLSDKEKTLIALVNFLFASQIMHSDDPVNFTDDEKIFTKKIEALFEKFADEEFGLLNKNSKQYFIFSKNGKYLGFINLDDKKICVKKSDLIFYDKNAGTLFLPEKSELKSIVNFSSEKEGRFEFEPHSISIFEI